MSSSALRCLEAELSAEARTATASLWSSPEWYTPSLGAANDVGRGNAGMDAQGHVGVGYLLVVYDRSDRLGGEEELAGLRQPAWTRGRSAAPGISHGVHAPAGPAALR